MSVEFLETLTADLLEYKHLVGLDIILEHSSLYNCTINIGSSNLDVGIICHEKDFGELHISTFGIGKPMHKDLISSFYLELLACNFNYCVH